MKTNSPRYSGAMPIRQAIAPTPYLFTPFLFTDERVEEATLLRAVRRLPVGAWVVFRHYGLDEGQRRHLFQRLRRTTRRRGVHIIVAGPEPRQFADADGWHLSGWQGRTYRRAAPLSASAHQMVDVAVAKRAGARVVFISPVFSTNSHKGARALGPIAYQRLARRAAALGMIPLPLGGMNAARARLMKASGFGAIDGLTRR